MISLSHLIQGAFEMGGYEMLPAICHFLRSAPLERPERDCIDSTAQHVLRPPHVSTISHETRLTHTMKPPRNSRQDPLSIAAKQLPPIVLLIGVLGLVSYLSQIILSPVYGSVGTGLHHYNVVFIISTATSFFTLLRFGNLPHRVWRAIALMLMSAPLLLPSLFQYSGTWGPVWGPIITQGVMTWPCVFLVSYEIARRAVQVVGKIEIQRSFSLPSFISLSIAIPLTVILNITERFLNTYFQPYNGVLWSRFSLLLFIGLFALVIDNAPSSSSAVEWINLLVIFAGVFPYVLIVLNRPHVATGVSPALLARLPKEYTYLDRRESITGMITVVENSIAGYRVLKCDHSLLGGLWVAVKRDELADKNFVGEELEIRSVDEAESVYTAFLVQEAVRLVKRPKNAEKVLIMYVHRIEI